MSTGLVDRPWVRRGLAVVVILALLSPAFAWAAGAVDYAEPLENAAEAAGASEAAEPLFSGFLPGYTLDGLNPYLGTLLSALLGSGLVLVIALGLGRLLSDSDAN